MLESKTELEQPPPHQKIVASAQHTSASVRLEIEKRNPLIFLLKQFTLVAKTRTQSNKPTKNPGTSIVRGGYLYIVRNLLTTRLQQ